MSPGGWALRDKRQEPPPLAGAVLAHPRLSTWALFPPWLEDTYHVKYIGHEHLHIHEQGRTPIVRNLDGFLNLLGPVEVEEGWPG